MKKTTIILSLLSAFALATTACGKDDKGESSGKAAGGKASALTIEKYGLQVDVAKGATQDEMLGDIMIQAPGYVFSVREAKESDPATIEAEKEEASMFSPKNMTDEKLADGYVFRFENKGSMGANFWVHVRRDIGGKTYYCTTMQGDKKMADNAVAACKSLRK